MGDNDSALGYWRPRVTRRTHFAEEPHHLMNAVHDFLRLVGINARNLKRTYAMARVTLSKRHSGSALGIIWALIKPLMLISALWFAVAVGIRGGESVNGVPYILWLLPGIMAWYIISDSLIVGGSAIRTNSHLVTKLVYPVATLPLSEVLSLFFVHLMLMGITVAIFLGSGFGLSIYFLQLPYYMLCTFVFAVIMATMLSALTAISTDILHGVKSVMTFLFWLSPVLWTTDSLSGVQLTIIKLNPITYLLSGYRNSFVTHHWFFYDVRSTAYFWGLMVVLALLASFVYSRLEPEFADVL